MPAKLVLALLARHVVTPTVLQDNNAAVWTLLATLLKFKAFKDSFLVALTALVQFRGLLSAPHADGSLAFAGSRLFLPLAAHIFVTAWPWAPTKVRVKVHHHVLLELLILLVDSIIAESLYISIIEGHLTPKLHAGYHGDIAVFDVTLKVVREAPRAKQVLTGEPK